MLSMQRPLASIASRDPSFHARIADALEEAGWQLGGSGAPLHDRSLLVIVGGCEPWAIDPPRHIVGVVGTDFDGEPCVDFTVASGCGLKEMVSVLQSWVPPTTEPLDRLLGVFGRSGFLPLVEGFQRSLALACGDHSLGNVSAHQLSGLSGTLGFDVLSRSWNAVDCGEGQPNAARRESRKALVAVTHWLDAQREQSASEPR